MIPFPKCITPQYYIERGKECYKKGDYRWALESFEKCVEYYPDYALGYYFKAETHKKLGMQKEAVLDYVRFLEVDYKTPEVPAGPSTAVEVAKFGLNIANIPVIPDVLDVFETIRENVAISKNAFLWPNANREINAFDLTKILDELLEDYSPEKDLIDSHFYRLAGTWLEKNDPENKLYLGFVQLLQNNFEAAVGIFNAAITEKTDPYAYYLQGVAYLKLAACAQDESSLLEKAKANFTNSLKNNFKYKICPKCGHKEQQNLTYCLLCGIKLLSN